MKKQKDDLTVTQSAIFIIIAVLFGMLADNIFK